MEHFIDTYYFIRPIVSFAQKATADGVAVESPSHVFAVQQVIRLVVHQPFVCLPRGEETFVERALVSLRAKQAGVGVPVKQICQDCHALQTFSVKCV